MGTRLKMFEDGLHILKAMFSREAHDVSGPYYTVMTRLDNPKPVQKPHPPITIGGSGEKIMLKLVARFADRWNCPAGYESFEHKYNVLKQHCKDVGRDVDTIDVSEQLLVCIGNSDAEVEAKWKAAQMLKPFVTTGIKGTPKQLIDQLKQRVAMGITTFTIFFSDFAPPPTLGAVREGSDAGICVERSESLRRWSSRSCWPDAPVSRRTTRRNSTTAAGSDQATR